MPPAEVPASSDVGPAPPHVSERRARRTVTVLAIALLVILGGGYLLEQRSRAATLAALTRDTSSKTAEALPVSAFRAVLAPGEARLRLPGATAAWYESTLYARVNGYVDKWLVDIGDTVHKGQVLALLATPDLDAELNAALARLEADQAEVQVRQAARDFARTTYARWHDAPMGVVAEQEREAKKADLESAVAQVAAAESRVKLDRAEVDRLQTLSNFKAVTAPIDGVVTERHIDIGNLVTAGSTANTNPLYKLAQDDRLRVFVDVPQDQAGTVSAGTVARLLAPGQPPVLARVTRTSGAVDPVARTLRVEVDVPNKTRQLKPGFYVQVEFATKASPLPRVPAAAVQFRAGGAQVALIGADGVVQFRPIRIARDEGNEVDVGDGLKAGEVVALNLSSQIAAGDHVTAQFASVNP